MQPRCPLTDWKPSPNFTPGRAGTVRAVVLHITQGSNSIGWLRSPASKVSSHFYLDRDGSAAQLVNLTDTAWANGLNWVSGRPYTTRKPLRRVYPTWPLLQPNVDPNAITISIELEGFSGEPLTGAQAQTLDSVLRWLLPQLDLPAWDAGTTLIGHYHINPTDKAFCPGISVNIAAIAARVNGLAGLKPSLGGTYRTTALAWVRAGPTTRSAKLGELRKGAVISGALRMGEVIRGVEDWLAFAYKGDEAFVWAGALERI
jgi:hypothetical protein